MWRRKARSESHLTKKRLWIGSLSRDAPLAPFHVISLGRRYCCAGVERRRTAAAAPWLAVFAKMADFLPSRSPLSRCLPGCLLNSSEAEQQRKSKEIDKCLYRDKTYVKRLVKILLLGAGESGKSTFLKQMRIIHGQDWDRPAREEFRATIYSNVIKGEAGAGGTRRRESDHRWDGGRENWGGSCREVLVGCCRARLPALLGRRGAEDWRREGTEKGEVSCLVRSPSRLHVRECQGNGPEKCHTFFPARHRAASEGEPLPRSASSAPRCVAHV